MRDCPVTFRPEALEDLADIFDHVRRVSQSLETGENVVRRIKARCDRIGHVPLGGRARPDLRPGLRSVAFERSVVIVYAATPDTVQIVNIFWGRRNYQALYRTWPDDDDG